MTHEQVLISQTGSVRCLWRSSEIAENDDAVTPAKARQKRNLTIRVEGWASWNHLSLQYWFWISRRTCWFQSVGRNESTVITALFRARKTRWFSRDQLCLAFGKKQPTARSSAWSACCHRTETSNAQKKTKDNAFCKKRNGTRLK